MEERLEVRVGPREVPRYRTVDELVVSDPVLGTPDMTVAAAARLMGERRCAYVAVPDGPGRFGLVTDRVLRERVLAAGLPHDTPIGTVMARDVRTVPTGTPTANVLEELVQHRLDQLLVVDPAGTLRGAVDPQDFLAAPSAAGVVLARQVERADTLDQVAALGEQLPRLLADLVRQRRDPTETTAVYATVLDAVQRRVLALVLDSRPALSAEEFTWMVLGSNARREPTLGSDIDSAVVFADGVPEDRRAAYREAFTEVADALCAAGLKVDRHGATPANPRFARSRAEWRAAAEQWLRSPLDDQGMLMASLLLDGRSVHGRTEPVVHEVFADVREHPGTLRFLIRESLTAKARLVSVRDVLAGRGGTFDLKAHALRPIVEIARWAALSVRSPELSTRARLTAASGTVLLPTEQAETLVEVFDVLQRTRLRVQLAQREKGEPVSDVVRMRRLPPLDRSLVAQSVREIGTVQTRLGNLLQYTSPDEWAGVS